MGGGVSRPTCCRGCATSGWPGRCCSAADFPNIPYPYAHQLEALEGLGLGDDWLRAVCWDNGCRLFGKTGDDSSV